MFNLHRRKKGGSPGKEKEEDVEAGRPGDNSGSTMTGETDQLGEYAALDRYISTYREEGNVEDDGASSKVSSRRWWQFWKILDEKPQEPKQDVSIVPDAWMATDIKDGIRYSEVEERRRIYGWNELASEKENMFAKFLGFFKGPILYGKLN